MTCREPAYHPPLPPDTIKQTKQKQNIKNDIHPLQLYHQRLPPDRQSRPREPQTEHSRHPLPAIDADTGAKSRAFTPALQALDRHSPYFDFAELSDCLASIVPGNHVTAQTQASDAKLNMRDSPFNVTYVSPECFLLHDKTPANPALLHTPASTRPAGIQFLRVSFLVDVNHFAPIGATNKLPTAPFLGHYDLQLPQSPVPTRRGLGRELFPARADPGTPPPIFCKRDELPDLSRAGRAFKIF